MKMPLKNEGHGNVNWCDHLARCYEGSSKNKNRNAI